MKLYIMECIYDPETAENPFSPGMTGQKENFVKFTRDTEQQIYDESIGYAPNSKYHQGLWDGYMSAWLEWDTCDENIYYYIEVDGDVEIGETYTDADGLAWERVE